MTGLVLVINWSTYLRKCSHVRCFSNIYIQESMFRYNVFFVIGNIPMSNRKLHASRYILLEKYVMKSFANRKDMKQDDTHVLACLLCLGTFYIV